MGGYPIFSLMSMFDCTRTSTNCVFILITDQVLKTHKERLFFYLSKNTADTLHDPSGVSALFVLFTRHSLTGKGREGEDQQKDQKLIFNNQSQKRNHCLAFLTVAVKLEVSSSCIRNMQNPRFYISSKYSLNYIKLESNIFQLCSQRYNIKYKCKT